MMIHNHAVVSMWSTNSICGLQPGFELQHALVPGALARRGRIYEALVLLQGRLIEHCDNSEGQGVTAFPRGINARLGERAAPSGAQ